MNIKRTSDYASLAAAITAIGASDCELIVDKAEALGGNVTIPANVHCLFVQGGIITTTGYTLTFNSTPEIGMTQAFAGTGTVIFDAPIVVYPQWFGATADGTTDDTSAIQAAVDAVSEYGGTVFFPTPGRYVVKDEITVTSDHPVNLISDMAATTTGDGTNGSYIDVGDTISGSVFKMETLGALIRGLYIRDTTGDISDGSQGTNSIEAAIYAYSYSMGRIEDCYFDSLLGSAIKTRQWIRGNMCNIHVRHCGDTDKPVIYLAGTSDTFVTQAVNIDNIHIEVCYDEYIYLNEYAINCKISNGQFETDNTGQPTSCQYYIYNNGYYTSISNSVFNRNDTTSVYSNRGNVSMVNCRYSSAPTGTTPMLHLAGSYSRISNCIFVGTASHTGCSIYESVGINYYSNCLVYYGGNVQLGYWTVWNGGGCYDLKTTEAYAIVCDSHNIISGAVVSHCDNAGGIHVKDGSVISGCIIRYNAGIGLYNTANNTVIQGNRISNNTGGDVSFTSYPRAYMPNCNLINDGAYPLQAGTTWNPGSISPGGSESTTITVTGSTVGDAVIASFPMLEGSSQINGMLISGSITAANTARITICNASASAVDLSEGTLTVKVIKT